MESSEKAEPVPEPAPETLPADVTEEKPKRTKLLAVIVVAVLIVAALAAAWGLGVFGGPTEENIPPTAGAHPTTVTTINIGESVSFESTANDTDGTIVDYKWYFGDGGIVNGSDLVTVTHTYNYGGNFWV
ncbi:MAG: PKD domain-containing protein, partial [Thermoplasmata archaeon]|nr:PKD domain-containing protein [Thermoplasmata archaeon]